MKVLQDGGEAVNTGESCGLKGDPRPCTLLSLIQPSSLLACTVDMDATEQGTGLQGTKRLWHVLLPGQGHIVAPTPPKITVSMQQYVIWQY